MFDKKDAEKIARKVGAEIKNGKRHKWAFFKIDRRPYRFGIRHGSNSHHTHLTKDLRLPLTEIKKLVGCSMSAEEYFEIQKNKPIY